METRFQEAVEMNRKIFGTPVFQHESGFRSLNGSADGDDWDMMIPARPLDITHTVDTGKVDGLLLEIRDDPPPLRKAKDFMAEGVIEIESEEQED